MHQTPLIAAIFLLFLTLAVSGLPIPVNPRGRHPGHHRIHHGQRDHMMFMSSAAISVGQGKTADRPGAQQGTPATQATQRIHVRVPHVATPRIPVIDPPPVKPRIPFRVPARPHPLPLGSVNISQTAKMFGWDPRKVIGGCGAHCDLINYLLKQEFLIAHNWVRHLFKLPPFTWDDKLESAARQYALVRSDDCKNTHSDLPYGENIFWGLRLHWTASDAVFDWFNESKWYDFKSITCSPPPGRDCGHFTQIVWKDSVRLGCALQHCRDPTKGMLVVCEYDPPGNYDKENPLDDNNAKHQV